VQIIPVLDLARGIAVHARGGDRSRYQPLVSELIPNNRAGDAVALVRAYSAMLPVQECYLADLDAIQGGGLQRGLIGELARTHFSGQLMVDSGISDPNGALEVLACGASQVVIGLESLPAFSDLTAILTIVPPGRLVFSLDLRLGSPVLHSAMQDHVARGADAISLAEHAVATGVVTLLVLDLERVGAGCGVDVRLLEMLRHRFPGIRLLAGGGVRSREDLELMRDAGCDAALIGSAIHAGRVTAMDIATLSRSAARPAQSGASAS
jgi:phosphoribosylformimino-5-aminoimidazole carboxamide ribotide isomerase